MTHLEARPILLNALTVDVEEHFQVSGFADRIAQADWERQESRVCASTERLLDILAESGVRATFFILGWVAERYPGLVRKIARAGHEIASHGYGHGLVYTMSPAEFRTDLRLARTALEGAGGLPVTGYRAPSFSITQQSMWALDVLIEEGYLYDSSIYPIHHDRYGIPGWERHLHLLQRPAGAIWELPGSTVRRFGANFPIGGGGYFRLLPYAWTRLGMRAVHRRERQATTFYLHPWEVDPAQPRIQGSPLSRFRHYRNLHKTEGRLRRLLAEFRFGAVSDVIKAAGAPGAMDGLPRGSAAAAGEARNSPAVAD